MYVEDTSVHPVLNSGGAGAWTCLDAHTFVLSLAPHLPFYKPARLGGGTGLIKVILECIGVS